MRRILVFDVEGTLLDPGGLDAPFAAAFGETSARAAWTEELQRLVFVCAIAAGYRPYAQLADEALGTIAARRGRPLDGPTRAQLLAACMQLPAFAEVPHALARLRERGFALHALSNTDLHVVQAQLQRAELLHLFDSVQSAQQSESYKPRALVYRNALTAIDAVPETAMMVTAHAWDAVGAAEQGLATALVARDGTPPSALARHEPAIVARDVAGVMEQLLFFPVRSGAA